MHIRLPWLVWLVWLSGCGAAGAPAPRSDRAARPPAQPATPAAAPVEAISIAALLGPRCLGRYRVTWAAHESACGKLFSPLDVVVEPVGNGVVVRERLRQAGGWTVDAQCHLAYRDPYVQIEAGNTAKLRYRPLPDDQLARCEAVLEGKLEAHPLQPADLAFDVDAARQAFTKAWEQWDFVAMPRPRLPARPAGAGPRVTIEVEAVDGLVEAFVLDGVRIDLAKLTHETTPHLPVFQVAVENPTGHRQRFTVDVPRRPAAR